MSRCARFVQFLVALATLGACSGAVPPTAPSLTFTSTPSPASACIPWYAAPDYVGETTCVEGRLLMARVANAPRFAFFIFDPSYTTIDHCCGDFHAWVYSEDWCEYFSECRRSRELDDACLRVFGTVERDMGRVRIEVRERSQIEVIDCAACQEAQACLPHNR
jgi:hypothetical protein